MTKRRVPNPYKGRPGLGNRINAALFPIIGPPAVGSGGAPESTAPPREAATCPQCGVSYAKHHIRRGSGPSQASSIQCPSPDEVEAGQAGAPAN